MITGVVNLVLKSERVMSNKEKDIALKLSDEFSGTYKVVASRRIPLSRCEGQVRGQGARESLEVLHTLLRIISKKYQSFSYFAHVL